GKDLSRLAGGIGTRGPGESKLEVDRRHLKRRIAALQEQLDELDKNRMVQRSARDKNDIKIVTIVGYTNAGKSTFLNYLTDAGILAEDKLFATLDPTTRRLILPDKQEVLLTDTVGFIDRLPTHLVRAFKSTLEELKYADIIINLTDASDADEEIKRKSMVTEKLITELGGESKPVINVYNKIDIESDNEFIPKDAVRVSAKTGSGMENFLNILNDLVNAGKKRVEIFIPHSRAGEVNSIYKNMTVLTCDYTDEGTLLLVEGENKYIQKYKELIKE
ncbi:GTPase HflX, partial [Eubacteriales bacterium OttesenSCG-928-G02]|nr:GTPase HflX [Eubacteriales bacterium OttesenSCG-928-G02]